MVSIYVGVTRSCRLRKEEIASKWAMPNDGWMSICDLTERYPITVADGLRLSSFLFDIFISDASKMKLFYPLGWSGEDENIRNRHFYEIK